MPRRPSLSPLLIGAPPDAARVRGLLIAPASADACDIGPETQQDIGARCPVTITTGVYLKRGCVLVI